MASVQARINFPVKKSSSEIRVSKEKSRKIIVESSLSENESCSLENKVAIERSQNKKNEAYAKKNIVTPRKTKTSSCTNEDTHVTPPKQRRCDKTESTDDVENISIRSPTTPSSLLAKLDLGTISCDHDNADNEKVSRRKLFINENNKYDNARKALHSTAPTHMPARQEELEELRGFIGGHLENKTSGTLYISGPPGTGKTAALTKTFADMKIESQYKGVYINCTAIKSAQAVYSKIATGIGLKSANRTEKGYLSTIEKHLTSKHKPIILVLDEIDQLDSRKQSVLYTIFEWPSRHDSGLVLIGIANALDLTDRVLPRLQARCDLKPKLMHFAPYSKQQIVEIIADRLGEAGVTEVFSPVAVQMLAGKVAAVSGDVRRALDIARRVIEMVVTEQRTIRLPLQSTENIDEITKDQLKSVGVTQIVSVLNNVYGTCQNLQQDVDESVPLQQKLLLCSLILMLKKGKNKDVTVGRLHQVYRKVCQKRNLSAIDQSEFVGLCSLLETRGMIRIQSKKEPRLNRVCLEWDEDEVGNVLKDKQLMSTILQDESVLSN
ncbi:Cdc6 [Carabus blaptoides fortunei]